MKITIIQLSMIVFIIAFFGGMIFTYIIVSVQVANTISNLRIDKVEIGFNESYIMDRMEKIISEQNSLNKIKHISSNLSEIPITSFCSERVSTIRSNNITINCSEYLENNPKPVWMGDNK